VDDEGTYLPWAAGPQPVDPTDETLCDYARDVLALRRIAKEPTEVGFGFRVGEEGEDLNEGGYSFVLSFV